MIDSLGIMHLIGFLEQEMGLTIGDGEMVHENFETMRKILKFIERKQFNSPR